MQEPIADHPPPPAPFDETPRGGWARPVGFGCGALALLLVIALTVLAVNATRIFAWSLESLQAELLAHPPEGFGEADARRLERAFSAARRAIQEDGVPAEANAAVWDLQEKAWSLGSTPPQERSREELLALAEILERLAGTKPPAEPPDVPAAPAATPDTAAV